MEYKEAIDWLFAQLPMFSRIGAAAYKPGLDRSYRLADFFDNPQTKFKSIHIGGTNGKGSVSNLIAAVLQSQGYKTGLYTSPHLVDFRERIRINGEMISQNEVINFIEKWQSSGYDGDKPSFFELTMMMAFDWFARENVDFAVIEVGMGGRLDSTNIITPLLSVITNISKDHTQFLGDTIEKIAFEKAGIIKREVPVVIGEADEITERVFAEKAKLENAPLRAAYNEDDESLNEALHCSLHGEYQKKNVNTARVAIDELRKGGIDIDYKSVRNGFENVERLTGFRGRWTVLSQNPLTICDTGHNEAGLTYNLAQLAKLKEERPDASIRFVIGFVADKDIDNILKLFPDYGVYYLTQAQIPRALHYAELERKFIESHPKISSRIKAFENVMGALKSAHEDAKTNDIIFIGGSTFIVADALSLPCGDNS